MNTPPLPPVAVAILGLLSAPAASAQMTTGSAMTDFAPTFGISARGWAVEQLSCSLGANVLWPGEAATFTFFLKPGQAHKGPMNVDVIQYGTKGKPDDWWKPIVFKIADSSTSTVDVDVPAEGGVVTVQPKIGETFGGYALVFDLGERGTAFELAAGRSVSQDNCFSFHNDWTTHWANEVEFGAER